MNGQGTKSDRTDAAGGADERDLLPKAADRNHKRRQEIQTKYVLVLDGHLRDREFEQTKHEFCRWICRLSKPIWVDDILVRVQGHDKSMIFSDSEPFFDMLEKDEDVPRWVDYLYWKPTLESDLPLVLARKYHIGEVDCAEYNRQQKYFEGR